MENPFAGISLHPEPLSDEEAERREAAKRAWFAAIYELKIGEMDCG